MPRSAPGSIEEAIDNFVSDVRIATLNSVVSITPPGDRYAKDADGKGLAAKARAKQGIAKLQAAIKDRFIVNTAVPAGETGWHVTASADPAARQRVLATNLFLLDKRTQKARLAKSTLPILGSSREIVQWLRDNSRYTSSGKTVVQSGRAAFYRSTSQFFQAVKQIQKNAGMFMAGWYKFYEALGRKMTGFVPASAMSKAHEHQVSSVRGRSTDDKIIGVNAAQSHNRRLDQYAQSLMDEGIPSSTEYYSRPGGPTRKALERALQKYFNYDKKSARDLSSTIKIKL